MNPASSHTVRSCFFEVIIWDLYKCSCQQFPAAPFVLDGLPAKEPTSDGFNCCDNFSFSSELDMFTPVDSWISILPRKKSFHQLDVAP